MPDLQDEFAIFRELQDLPILLAIGSDPYEAFRIDMDGYARSAQSYPWPGPPHECNNVPSWANSSTGGAGAQHLLVGGLSVAAFSSAVSVFGRWMTQMWSSASTATPEACPIIQLLGSAFGHVASTSKRGVSAAQTGQLRAMQDA